MKAILEKLKIDETFTKAKSIKQKQFNHIKNNIPLVEDYNFMADLIEFPLTKKKNKFYCRLWIWLQMNLI